MTIENIIDFFIPSAQAQSMHAAPPPGSGGGTLFIMLLVFLFFMYLTVWRPQNKRAKEHRDMLGGLSKGDEVVTTGGIIGKVSKLTDAYVVLAVSDTVEMTLQKSSIATVLPKGTLKSI
jgi:preprotein translocase subunit YajC